MRRLQTMRRNVSYSILVAVALSLCSCDTTQREIRLVKKGEELVAKIENFREEKGRLPNSLKELGIEEKEEGPLHYAKRGESAYVVWFGTTVGESVAYDSRSKKWQ